MHRTTINPMFKVADLNMTRIWHCFGNYMHKVDLTTIVAMLSASHTNVLPINTHSLDKSNGRDGLLIGFGGVKYDELAERVNLEDMIVMLNINHQTNVHDAVNKTTLAYELTSEKIIKLEVLNADLKTSNDTQLIQSVSILKKDFPDLVLMPLVGNNFDMAKQLVDLGCPLLRVMGSAIGDAKGILDAPQFKKICSLPVPVILDGGVRDARDLRMAVELGAQGCLINSALFLQGNQPEVELETFLHESQDMLRSAYFSI
jgi:thiazole synthase